MIPIILTLAVVFIVSLIVFIDSTVKNKSEKIRIISAVIMTAVFPFIAMYASAY